MSRHYSTNDFLRHVPVRLLTRYFKERGLLPDFDFAGLKDAKTDALLAALLELPVAQRQPIDAEFSSIFEMSCEKGFKAILTEVPYQFRDTPEDAPKFIDKLSGLSSHYERAMATFLDHPAFWRAATLYRHADSLTSFWRKRKNLPHKLAAVDPVSLKKLEEVIGGYFHYKEGRGKNCAVEPYRRGELDYFFAFPEDYSQQQPEWVSGIFTPRPHTPAFEVIFIYSQKDGTLDINYQGSPKTIEPLQGMFATSILGLEELPPDPKDERVYELGALMQKSFEFKPEIDSGIEGIAIKKMRLSSKIKRGDRLTLEADISENPKAIYTLLDKLGKAVPLQMYNVTLVEMTATVAVEGDKPPRKVPIRITHPNSCSLKYDEIDHRLRDMLASSGIELKDPEPEAEPPSET